MCAKMVLKVVDSGSDRMEEIYCEYEDKVVLVTGGAGFPGLVLPGPRIAMCSMLPQGAV